MTKPNSDLQVSTYSEDGVLKMQTKFEERLFDNYSPDAISGDEIYIYKNLMSKWYSVLSSKNRYDENLIQKLRNDWVDYMIALQDRSTTNYLSLESEGTESEKYREDHINASRKVFAIEEAFAHAIGDDAVKQLAEFRGPNRYKYSISRRTGDLAPEGFKYDTKDELVPMETK